MPLHRPPARPLPRHRAGRRRRAVGGQRPVPGRPPARRRPAVPRGARHRGDGPGRGGAGRCGMRAHARERRVPAADRGARARHDDDQDRGAATADRVDVAIRSSDTGFQADHFRATLRYADDRALRYRTDRVARRGDADSARPGGRPVRRDPLPGQAVPAGARLPPAGGHPLRGRDLGSVRRRPGSAPTFPRNCCSATREPGTRSCTRSSAASRTRRCCRLAVERIRLAGAGSRHASQVNVILYAPERQPGRRHLHLRPGRPRRRRTYSSSAGRACGCRRSARTDGAGPWVAGLLGPYLERRTEPAGPGCPARCAVEPDGRDRRRPGRAAQADDGGARPDARRRP